MARKLSPKDFHTYQDESVTMLYEHPRILAIMPTGAGKTGVSLTAFTELQRDGEVRRGVVLGPKRVTNDVWPSEPAVWEHLGDVDVAPLMGTPKQRTKILNETHDLYTVGFANIKWLWQQVETWKKDDPRLDVLIVDEVSCCKDPSGTWSKHLRKLAKKFKSVWLLTGTPRPNSDMDYYVYMAALTGDKLWGRNYDNWRRKFFYPTDFKQLNWEPHQHMQEELNNDVARHSFRVPMSAVPRPASDPIVHKIKMPAKARAVYKKMEQELFTTVDGQDIIAFSEAVSSGKLAQIAQGFIYDDDKTARALHHAKMGMLEELMQSNGGDASVIIYHFNEDLTRLQDAIPGLEYLGAGVPDQRAVEIMEEWNAGNLEQLAIHPASAGHGLNAQKTPAQLIHYALTWSAELYEQVVARVARQGYVGTTGQKEWMVLNHHIVMEDTIDEAKMSRVSGKLTAQQIAMQYINAVAT